MKHSFPPDSYETWDLKTYLISKNIFHNQQISSINSFVLSFMKHILGEEINPLFVDQIKPEIQEKLLRTYYVLIILLYSFLVII